MKLSMMLILLIFISSCSFAPLNSTKTARSLGDGNYQIDTGIAPTPYLSFSRGMSDNFDLGFTLETQMAQVFGITSKYSLINNSDSGGALALFGGVFQGLDVTSTQGFYIGPVLSYKMSWFEPYLVARYNWLKWNATEFSEDENDDFFATVVKTGDIELSYLQLTFGFNFWFSKTFAFNINGKYISFFGSDVDSSDETSVVPGLAFVWNF